ncbi:GcrA cell cycle regulator [Mesorhizobium loti]|uniref:GcrA cell cycle regulator n=1 Tax=Rhizobium loti TaxID=381 RepID=A0A8E2WJ76_RHILI|nr:GcrA family cell cycle regulator [Mesorhizobium loti]PWJ93571.1 GcrA cell cycle regulator [Mesorhizobium loti]
MTILPDWTTIPRVELDRLLVGYCEEGLTASAIAKKFLNASRSAVIGRVHRKKLSLGNGQPRKGMTGRRKADADPAPKVAKAKPVRASKLVQQTSSWRGANNPPASDFKARAEQRAKSPGLPAHLLTGEPRRSAIDLSIVPVSRKLALTELTEQTCKWPNGDPQAEDFGFCGNDAAETGPYCRYHARLASAPPIHRLSVPRDA